MDLFSRGHPVKLTSEGQIDIRNKLITIVVEKDILVPASIVVPFIDTLQMDSAPNITLSNLSLSIIYPRARLY